MNEEILECIERLKQSFPRSYIYKENELIVEPKNNIYFRIDDIKSEFEFRCMVISWLSRPAHKGVSSWWQSRIRNGINKFLGTDFSTDELSTIYTFVGCGCNNNKLKSFVESGYNLDTLTTKINSQFNNEK